MKKLLAILMLLPVLALADPPTTSMPVLHYDPATGHFVPTTTNGHTVGTVSGGVTSTETSVTDGDFVVFNGTGGTVIRKATSFEIFDYGSDDGIGFIPWWNTVPVTHLWDKLLFSDNESLGTSATTISSQRANKLYMDGIAGALQSPTGVLALGNFSSITGTLPQVNLQNSTYDLRDVASLSAHEIDSRILGQTAGSTAQNLFTTRDDSGSGTYVRSSVWFGHDLDLTSVSVYNTSGSPLQTVTLISPRHVAMAHHAFPANGTTFRFVQSDGTVVTRTLSSHSQIGSTDIEIGLLSSDVPAGISFMKICPMLPHNRLIGAPVIYTDQNQKAYLAEISTIAPTDTSITFAQPSTSPRSTFWKSGGLITGDSSHPMVVVLDGKPVLLLSLHTASGGDDLSANSAAINSAMTSLGGGYTTTPFPISAPENSAFAHASSTPTPGQIQLIGDNGLIYANTIPIVQQAYNLTDQSTDVDRMFVDNGALIITGVTEFDPGTGVAAAMRSGLGLGTAAVVNTGTGAGAVPTGGVITAGGPIGSSNAVPVITYNAAGQLTAVTTAAISSGLTIGTTAITSGSGSTKVLFDNSGTLGETAAPTLTGTNFTGIPESGVTNLTTDLAAKQATLTLGTGVLAALAVNVGSSGAFVTFNGAGGTPSSLTGTNISGTAASLTAGNVTTNANLTGPITSSGNATSVAAQTGTGSTFVMSAGSPVLNTAVLTGLPTGTGVASAATASTLVARDANGNINANSVNHGYTTTATAAGTTTLTVGSTNLQYFTGSTTQTVLLPVTSTLVLGQRFVISNNSTGVVTVQSSGANNIVAMAANTSATFTCILTSGTGTASWNLLYNPAYSSAGVLSVTSPDITTSITTPSTTFAIANTTATTVNAFGGASAALNIGNASGTTTLLGPLALSSAATIALAPASNTAATGLTLTDTTAATSGNQQYSPTLMLTGQGWKTTATAASQSVNFGSNVVPIQGTTAPTGYWSLGSGINTTTLTNPLTYTSGGMLTPGANPTSSNSGFKISPWVSSRVAVRLADDSNNGSITADAFEVVNSSNQRLAEIGNVSSDRTQIVFGANSRIYWTSVTSSASDQGNAGSVDTSLSRNGAGIVQVGTTSTNASGSLALTNIIQGGKTTTYNNIATAGNGLVAIVKATRVTAQSAANSSICTYTAPASDGSYEVSMNLNASAVTAMSASLNCDYTDESNTARTMIFPVQSLAGNFLTGGLITATGPYETPVMHIRVKASTAITLYTSAGTYTGTTYTCEGVIKQTQ